MSQLRDKLPDLQEQHRWTEAIALCERFLSDPADKVQIITPGSTRLVAVRGVAGHELEEQRWWMRATIGDLCLFDLRPTDAIRQYSFIRTHAPWDSDMRGRSAHRTRLSGPRAAYGLAQAYLQLGDYAKAVAWRQQYDKELPGFCGNGIEQSGVETFDVTQVWLAAAGPQEEAVNRLQEIAKGHFKTARVMLQNQSLSDETQRQNAAREARFLLGLTYYRAGDKQLARQWFAKIDLPPAESSRARVVSSYLSRMD